MTKTRIAYHSTVFATTFHWSTLISEALYNQTPGVDFILVFNYVALTKKGRLLKFLPTHKTLYCKSCTTE